jgi:hypothetical protein
MKAHSVLVFLLAGVVGVCTLTAGAHPRPAQADDATQAKKGPEEKSKIRLAALEARCKKTLELQIAVNDGTSSLHKIISDHTDTKPRAEDKQLAVKLAEKQTAIIAELTIIIEVLQTEATAVAFVEVLENLRDDMERVQKCLEKCEVGSATQVIEQDIIETLNVMITPPRCGR